MIKLMGVEYTFTWTEPNIKESGEKISNTVMELRPGLMEQGTTETTNTERSMEQALSSGLTTPNT